MDILHDFKIQLDDYKKRYEKAHNQYQEKISNIKITPFDVDYSKQAKRIFATDGSFIAYNKIPHVRAFPVSIKAVGVEQQYMWGGSILNSEYKNNSDVIDKYTVEYNIIMDLNKLKSTSSTLTTYMNVLMEKLENT